MTRRFFYGVLMLTVFIAGCGGGGDDSAAENMAEGHDDDSPTATEAAREPTVPVDAREVTYGTTENGRDITGYLAVPAAPDSLLSARGRDPSTDRVPGLVVIHEWWGLNENIRTATRRLAGEGYRALAVDLYDDSTAQTPEEAQALMKRATSGEDQVLSNLQAATEYLQAEGKASRVGVMGWCFGGGLTFRAVADRPTAFDAAVAYYGTPEAITEDVLQDLETPIQAHFGRQDEVVPPKQVEAFRSRLEGIDKEVQIYEYDAGHAFANPSGEQYEPDAAEQAWSRTTTFLETHLYPELETN
jgi:carboxymethylenebutenolidase